MKNIRTCAIFLLVGFLSLPLDVSACDSEKAALDAAVAARDAAEQEYAKIIQQGVSSAGGALTQPQTSITENPPSNDPSIGQGPAPLPPPNPPQPTTGGIVESALNNYIQSQIDAAKNKLERAKMAVSSAQYSLDQCRTPDIASCGHPMPGHTRHQYGCGHFDYSCQEGKHQLRSGNYRMCYDSYYSY